MEENLEPLETSDNDRIIPVNIEEQMKTAYIDYSMSVIVGPIKNRLVWWGKCWVNTIRMEIPLSMTPWFVWHRSGVCGTQW